MIIFIKVSIFVTIRPIWMILVSLKRSQRVYSESAPEQGLELLVIALALTHTHDPEPMVSCFPLIHFFRKFYIIIAMIFFELYIMCVYMRFIPSY